MFFYVSVLLFVMGSSYLLLAKKFTHWNFILVTGFSLWLIYIVQYPLVNHGLFSVIIQVMQNMLFSLLDVAQAFVLGREWDQVIYDASSNLLRIESLWHLILFCLAPILTFSTIIKYITETFFLVHLKLTFRKTLNIFYKDSQRHQNVLQTIANTKPTEKNIDSDFSGDKEDLFNTVYSEYSILRLKNIIKKHKKNYYFLDGDLDSLRESISLVESYGDDDSDDYLFVKDYQSLMANFLQKNPQSDNQLKIRIVNNDRFVLYQYFYENANWLAKIFEEEAILILGNNARALELMKMLLWLQQITETSLSIIYLYEEEKDKDKILTEMPEVIKGDSYEQKYTLTLLSGNKEDYSRVNEVIQTCQVSTVFILSKDTFYNLNTSDYINNNAKEPMDIFVAVDSEFILKTLKPIKDYHIIRFFSNAYIMNTIMDSTSRLEEEALAFHRAYENHFIEKKFYNNPYNYYSSMARAVGNAYLNKTQPKIEQQRAEHNRWSMYLKTNGWSYAPERNNLDKKHPLLIPFDELPEAEKVKDIN